MTEYPETINVQVSLKTGDKLPAVAFRQVGLQDGLVEYVVSYEDGGALQITRDQVAGIDIDVLPARSTMSLLLAET